MTFDVVIEEHLDMEIGGDADIDLSVEKEEDLNLSISEEIVDGTEDYRIVLSLNTPRMKSEPLIQSQRFHFQISRRYGIVCLIRRRIY